MRDFLTALTECSRDSGCPVYVYSGAFRPPPPPARSYEFQSASNGRVSGRGWSPDAARASCIGEAVERYSAMFRGDEHLTTAVYGDLGADAVAPPLLLQYSEHQYHQREIWNAAFGESQYIPEPWREDDPLEWVSARSLIYETDLWVPAAACYFQYAPPTPRIIFPGESTGFAAGATTEDAIVHGFLELVERDAVALWWYNRCARPPVDADAIGGERWAAARDFLVHKGRTVHVLDLTTDFAIPVFGAISATEAGDAVLFGFGAAFDPAEALHRAVAELLQMLGPVNLWTREAMLAHYAMRPDRKAWISEANTANQSYLLPKGSPVRPSSGFVEDRLRACKNAVAALGLDMVVVTLTRPDAGFPAVRVLVPGLRSSWRHLGPGRLFDVPVRLGWLREATPENRMNSFPFFL